MNERCLAALLTLTVIAIVLLMPVPASGQSQAQAAVANTWTPPHIPDGQPDWQGIWNNNISTLLERPEDVADTALFIEKERAAYTDVVYKTLDSSMALADASVSRRRTRRRTGTSDVRVRMSRGKLRHGEPAPRSACAREDGRRSSEKVIAVMCANVSVAPQTSRDSRS